MEYEGLQHVDSAMVIAPTTATDGTKCIGMAIDGQILLQIRKGMAPTITTLANQLATDERVQSAFESNGPIHSIIGPAVNVGRSHAEKRVIVERNALLIGLYVKAAVAECMAKKGMTQLDRDF